MSSDIDIEEHDLLEHPTIKTMFPDITNIKMEVDDEEIPDIEEVYEEPNYEPPNISDIENERYSLDDLHYTYAQSLREVSGNKIILGTIPIEEKDPYQAKVVLKDWKYILKKHPFYCNECLTLFPTQNTIDAHRMTAHSLLVAVDEESYSPPVNKARKSTTKSIAFYVGSRNVAVKSTSKNQVDTPSDDQPSDWGCPICKCIYISKSNFYSHAVKNHGTTGLEPEEVKFSGLCTYPSCSRHYFTRKSYMIHVKKTHFERFHMSYKEYSMSLKTSNVKYPKRKEAELVTAVPDGVLFKCNRCSLHFLAACVAWKHLAQCARSRFHERVCAQCNRSFRSKDVDKHVLQHELSMNFKVIVINQEVANMAMCKCSECGIVFDEGTFVKNHAIKCQLTQYETCDLCNMRVDKLFVDKHKKMHESYREFITVTWVHLEQPKYVQLHQSILTTAFYYCSYCKCYAYRRVNFHMSRRCVVKKCVPRICKLCGLAFSQKSFPLHLKRDHAHKFVLNDFEFYNLVNLEKISPPLPKWKKCNKCKINFFGFTAWRKHKCFEESNYKKCSTCKESFSDLAYKLHYPFHTYKLKSRNTSKASVDKMDEIDDEIDDEMDDEIDNEVDDEIDIEIEDKLHGILQKYESMESLWNIIYLCEICDIVFGSYDKVIEHCQDHFCNMESYDVKIEMCLACDLKFEHVSFNIHKQLHFNNVKKSAFKILKFNYEKLLSDAWMDIFKSISEEQKIQILAKSLYDFERGLRLYMEVDGSSANTLYKCNVCNSIVDTHSIVEHAKNQDNCLQIRQKFRCPDCDFMFLNKTTLESHRRNHRFFRILSFNMEKDFALNQVLCNLPRKGSLKFNWCKDCGLLIKKDMYNKHILKHKSKKKILGYVTKKTVQASERFDVYQCRKCCVTIYHKVNVKKHKCLPIRFLRKCTKCNLVFRASMLAKHEAQHRLQPTFNRKNINVVPFGPKQKLTIERIEKRKEKRERRERKRVLYQCPKCKACMGDRKTRRAHACVGNLDSLHMCDICRVYFNRRSFGYHQVLHRNTPGLTLKDFTVVRSDNNAVVPTEEAQSSTQSTSEHKKDSSFVYKCSCNLLFVSRSHLTDHMEKCDTDRLIETCKKCKLKFHANALEAHSSLKMCGPNSFIVCDVEIKNEHIHANDWWTLQCVICQFHSLSEKGIKYHFSNGHELEGAITCRKCNVTFTKTQYFKHTKKIHSELKCTIDCLNVVNCISMSDGELRSLTVADEKPVTPVSVKKASVGDGSKQTLYKCPHCIVHFACTKALNYHMERKLHMKKSYPCRYCGLHFTKILVRRHERTTHTIDDFDITIPFASGDIPLPLNIATTPTKTDANESEIDGHTNEERAALKKLAKDLKIIFQCTICKTNFMHPDSAASHMATGQHDGSYVNCEDCGLAFTTVSLKKHKQVHHSGADFNLEEYAFQCYTSAKDHFIKMPTASTSENNVTSSDVTDLKVTSRETADAPKLYKCKACDVYFTTHDMCCEHATDHIALDSTEYISCKICDLQFICECIGVHMRAHREKTFSIDDLVIIEFLPQSVGPPTTDSYLAIDRLKSIISTTTDCE